MAKTHKQRVKIGIDENRTPIYKWATGHNVDELNDRVVRLYVEHGLIDRFLHVYRKQPEQAPLSRVRRFETN